MKNKKLSSKYQLKLQNKLCSSWFADDRYDYLSIDEKLTLSLGNMMYGIKPSSLSFDDNKIYEVLKSCNNKSWRNLCNKIYEFYGVIHHEINKKLILMMTFKKFMNEFLIVSNSYYTYRIVKCKNEIGHLLRLWHLLRYDKNKIYEVLNEYQDKTPLPIYKFISSQLIELNNWQKSDIIDIMNQANIMIADYSIN